MKGGQNFSVEENRHEIASFTYVLRHLVSNLFEEAFLLLLSIVIFTLELVFIASNLLVVPVHHVLIKVLLLGHLLLVSFQSFLPGGSLGGVVVLDDTVVQFWHNVAAIVEWLDLASHQGSVSNQTVISQVYMAINSRSQKA